MWRERITLRAAVNRFVDFLSQTVTRDAGSPLAFLVPWGDAAWSVGGIRCQGACEKRLFTPPTVDGTGRALVPPGGGMWQTRGL